MEKCKGGGCSTLSNKVSFKEGECANGTLRMGRCSAPLPVREMPVKATMRCPPNPQKGKTKERDSTPCWRGRPAAGPCGHRRGPVTGAAPGEQAGSAETEMHLRGLSTAPGACPRDTAASFAAAPNWRKAHPPAVDEWKKLPPAHQDVLLGNRE